jgi:hypothetical protein
VRSSVNFGNILNGLIRERMPYFEPAFSEVSNQFLLYGFKKQLSTAHSGYILVQASRTQGRYALEVAISRGNSFPIHRLNDFPDIGVVGYRESVFTITKGYNHSEEYPNGDALFKLLYAQLKDAELALSRLAEKVLGRTQRQYDQWAKVYEQWLTQEKTASGPHGARYPALSAEHLGFEIIEKILTSGMFDKYLGPLKYKYRNPNFMNCHVFLLAKGLEFVEFPDHNSQVPMQYAPPEKKLAPPLDDPIAGLTGRHPQADSIEFSQITAQKMTQYAFLKSLSAVEALLTVGDEGRPLPVDGYVPFEGDLSGLIDAPVYDDAAAFDFQPLASMPSKSPVQEEKLTSETPTYREMSMPKPALSKVDDDDPIAALEARLGFKKP